MLAIGVALLFLPGPGSPLVIGGLALLATEFVWAARLLRRVRVEAARWRRAVDPRRETETTVSRPDSEPGPPVPKRQR